MLNKSLIGACLALCLAACATTATTPTAKSLAASAQPPAGCVASTATRLPVSPSECAAFGRMYTRDDIANTGAVDAAGALHMLDPAVTGGR